MDSFPQIYYRIGKFPGNIPRSLEIPYSRGGLTLRVIPNTLGGTTLLIEYYKYRAYRIYVVCDRNWYPIIPYLGKVLFQ